MPNYNPRTASSHRCSYFPGGESSVQGEGNSIVCGTVYCGMQIIVGPVKQAAQSRCVLWRASQNTCWRWGSEQRASSHSSMWFYFSLVWAQWLIFLKHAGTTDRERDRLKISVKTPASWKAHALSTRPGIPSGPMALRMFTRLKDRITSATESVSGLTSSAAVMWALSVWAVLSASKRA